MAAYRSSTLEFLRVTLPRPLQTRFIKSSCLLCKNVEDSTGEKEEFRVYQIEGLKKTGTEARKARWLKKSPPPRYRSMPTDQDWTNVWPTAQTFKWSAIPFPVRQGFVESSSENDGVVPSKYANLELMKGPNFLHLTPAHIKKQCQAIKKFCTDWPAGLETDERCRQHFGLESVTSDYVFAAPTLTDDRARLASIKFHLSDLELDYHARDKFIRLVGDRYDPETDQVIFQSDRCPLKSQNLEYVKFLLTAVFFESWKVESWEKLKELSDMEKYVWEMNQPKKTCLEVLRAIKKADEESSSDQGRLNYILSDVTDDESLCSLSEVKGHKEAVEDIFNEGENVETLNNYKKSVEKLLNLKSSVNS